MVEQENIYTHLDKVFDDMVARLNGATGSTLHQFQEKSFEALKEVRFPDKKFEDWKYTPVQQLLSPRYKLANPQSTYKIPDIPDLKSYVIPVINGHVNLESLDPHLISLGIKITPLSEAMQKESWKSAFEQRLASSTLSPNRAFELLNFTFHAKGFFVEIPDNTILDFPIEIQIIHDEPDVSFSHPLSFFRCGQGAKVDIIERFEKNITSSHQSVIGLINSVCYLFLDQNASVSHIKWQHLSREHNLVYKLHVTQLRDSRFETFAFDHGGHQIRNNVEVELEQSNTYSSLLGGYMASGHQRMDHQTRINHKVPHGESHELYKGIIDENATGAFNGKVLVHKDAQKTNAYQQNDTLVLSPNALMNSKPQLEIFADDVKCSHGATIGQLDQKSLFYLKSRGLKDDAARHMLKKAFIAEVLEKVPQESIRNFISSQMGLAE
jgi:Fe-S cluster assembly protein SufD